MSRNGSESNAGVRYPDVEVELVGGDGNAFAILGAVRKALRRALDREEFEGAWAEYQKEATAGDYNHLLATTMRWMDVR
jgi:hypothetical protein